MSQKRFKIGPWQQIMLQRIFKGTTSRPIQEFSEVGCGNFCFINLVTTVMVRKSIASIIGG